MLRNRSRCGRLRARMRTLKSVVTAHHARGSSFKLDRVFGRHKALPSGQKSRFRLPAIASGTNTLEERGYCFFPDAEAAADTVAASFLYSALA
jgi:hypothetical protein